MGANENSDDTTSQVTDPENQDQDAGDANQSGNDEKNWVPQERFDEVTKARREAERRAAQLEAEKQELVNALTQRMSQPQHDTGPEIDPDQKAILERVLSPLQAEIRRLSAKVESQGVEAQVRQQVGNEYPAEVVQVAAQVMADWKMNGTKGDLDAALDYAYGKYMRAQASKNQNANAQKQQFNKGASTVQNGQGGNGAPGRGARKLSDAEIEKLSPEDQVAYYESRVDPNEAF